MLLREYGAAWPPSITIGDAAREVTIPPKAGLADVVLNVQNQGPGELRIRLRRSKNREYTVLLSVPVSRQRKIMADIGRKKTMTLRQIGELPIS